VTKAYGVMRLLFIVCANNLLVGFAILLLEYGADINALAATGETPLTTAIKCNSHNTLRAYFLTAGPNMLPAPVLKGLIYSKSRLFTVIARRWLS